MGILAETMLDENVRPQVVSDYTTFISSQVASKSGPTGMMIKAAYKGLKGVKPGYMEEVVEVLLPSFMDVLDKQHVAYSGNGEKGAFDTWISGRSHDVAEELLAITDEVVQFSDKKVVIKIYGGIRKIAKKHVSLAVPEMAAVTMKYLD